MWEYDIIEIDLVECIDDTERRLDALGRDGWEVITVLIIEKRELGEHQRVYLKRFFTVIRACLGLTG